MKLFKRWEPKAPKRFFKREDRFRGAPTDRGYDHAWRKLSESIRREKPFCEECDRVGVLEPAAYVDHKIPLRHRPELRLDRDNLWCLCVWHHTNWKFRMELYAEKSNKVDELKDWCDHPAKRPRPFR